MNELQLQTGAYRTTFIGTEIIRESTPQEWHNYGEILRRVDEAKQWAIGDWLVDGKRHYGDGLYEKAAGILGCSEGDLRNMKSIAERFQLSVRTDKLSWRHHYEVASVKLIVYEVVDGEKTGRLELSDEPDQEKIHELLEMAEKKKLSVRDLRSVVKEYKKQQRETIRLANEPEKYSVVYADPPWKYDNSGFAMSAEKQYDVMETKDICALLFPVAENAVCFLWVTNPLLPDGLAVMNAWGFEYKTNMVWVKKVHTAGFYVFGQHEILLIGVKGDGMLPSEKHKSIIKGDNSIHSKKPHVVYDLIDSMYPVGKKIELFARNTKEGWDSWGNEI